MKPTPQDMEVHRLLGLVTDKYKGLAPTLENVLGAIRETCIAFHGIAEIGTSNTGYWVDIFASAIGVHGVAWCCAYVQYVFWFVSCIVFKIRDLLPYNTASTQGLWEWAHEHALTRTDKVEPGDCIVWRDGGKYQGHIGIALTVDDGVIFTSEGNASGNKHAPLPHGVFSHADLQEGANWRDGGHIAEKDYTLKGLNMGVKSITTRWTRGAISLRFLLENAQSVVAP
jgi:hypothetical protein